MQAQTQSYQQPTLFPVYDTELVIVAAKQKETNKVRDFSNGQYSSPLKIALAKVERLILQNLILRRNYSIWLQNRDKRIAELEKRLSKYETV